MKSIIIKSIAEKEIDNVLLKQIQQLLDQLTTISRKVDLKNLKTLIKHPNFKLFVAIAGDDVIGMVSTTTFQLLGRKKMLVDDLIVDKNYRKLGIGRNLMKNVINYAKENQINQIEFTSHPSRIEANKLYKSLDFEKRDTNFYRLKLD